MNYERFFYEARESELVMVLGERIVTAYCKECGVYFNSTERW